MASLEGWGFTIKLHPRDLIFRAAVHARPFLVLCLASGLVQGLGAGFSVRSLCNVCTCGLVSWGCSSGFVRACRLLGGLLVADSGSGSPEW